MHHFSDKFSKIAKSWGAFRRAVASTTYPGGGRKKFQVGPNIYHRFFKFEVKNRRKSAEEAKALYLMFVTSVLFFKVLKQIHARNVLRQIYISKWQ